MTPKNSVFDREIEFRSGRSWLVVSRIADQSEGQARQESGWLKLLKLSLISILLCFASGVCFAQSDRGSVSGIVTDPTGSGVTGARVTVTNAAMGTQNSTVTTGV